MNIEIYEKILKFSIVSFSRIFSNFSSLELSRDVIRDARMGDRGKVPPQQKKLCRKMFFPEVYKMTNVLEDEIENAYKVNFPLRLSYVNLKFFSKNSDGKLTLYPFLMASSSTFAFYSPLENTIFLQQFFRFSCDLPLINLRVSLIT